MKIAIAQINTRGGDFEATLAKIVACDAMAQTAGADLLVFPAPTLMGTDPMALAENPAYIADLTDALGRIAANVATPALVPFVAGLTGTPSPEAALVKGGSVMPVSIAGLVSSLGAMGLSGMPAAGQGAPMPLSVPSVVDVNGVDVGVAFTFDDLDAFAAGEVAADVICFIPFDGFNTDDEASCMAPSVADGCFTADAKDADSWIVAANAAGGWEDQVYVGGSFVMAPWGELAAVARSFTDDFLVCEIDVLSEGPLVEPVPAPAYDRARILWDAAALATRDFATKLERAGVSVVADGTLASAATVALAVDALGPMRVHALVTGEGEALADARELVRNLRIRDVDELGSRELEKAAEALGADGSGPMTAGLVQARLGAWAREANLLVLSCADKTALAVGADDDVPAPAAYAESFAPLGDVYRSDVARIARHRNTVSPVIPAGSLARFDVPRGLGLEELAISDELRASELDAALLLHIERGAGLTELASGKWGEAGAAHLLERVADGALARRQGPIYPVLSSRSLAEAQGPVTDGWRDRLRECPPEMPDEAEMNEAIAAFGAELGIDLGAGQVGGMPGMPGAGGQKAGGPMSGAGTAPGAGAPNGVPKASMRSRISEVMGYLQELSDGSRMRGEQTGQAGDDIWRGYFSDN